MKLNKDILHFHSLFKRAKFDLFPVGGCVRDHLDGRNPTDIDLATNALPEDIERILFGLPIDFQGKAFGVMRVFTENEPKGYEIATYREDMTSGRNPEVRVGSTIEKDAERRDFTINALYYDIDKGEILDFVGGLDDFKNKRLMMPGNPEDRLTDDRLRIPRGIRFESQLEFEFDEKVSAAIKKNNKLIGPDKNGKMIPIPQERIIDEFLKGIKRSVSTVRYLSRLEYFEMFAEMFKGIELAIHSPALALNAYVESKVVEIVLANLFMPSSELYNRMVKDLKFSKEIAEGTKFLMEIRTVNENNAMAMKKRMDKTSLTNESILEYAKIMNMSPGIEKNIVAFTKYDVTTDGNAMIANEGFTPGKALGDEISKREKEKFLTLLEQ